MSEGESTGPDVLHQLRNHLSIIVGFCDLLMNEVPEGDAKHADLEEMRKAGNAAIALVPQIAERMR